MTSLQKLTTFLLEHQQILKREDISRRIHRNTEKRAIEKGAIESVQKCNEIKWIENLVSFFILRSHLKYRTKIKHWQMTKLPLFMAYEKNVKQIDKKK